MTGRAIFSPKPVVIGHRGFGRGVVDGHAENTLASYQAAVDAGLSWVEVDVARSRDDRLVVIHNPSTPDGVFVADQTTDELATKGVPRIEDVFDALPPGVAVDIDVKSALEDAPLAADRTVFGLLAPVLRTEQERRGLLVSSFDAGALVYLREQVPGIALGLIGWVAFPLRIAVSAAAHLGLDVVCAHIQSFGPNIVEPGPVHRDPAYSIDIAHQAGLEVLAWCPGADEAAALVAAGIDALCVNDVPAVLTSLQR